MTTSEPDAEGPEFKTKVLVVDDDPMILRMMGNAIDTFGYENAGAANGLEALARLEEENDFTIVVTDMIMPEMDGMELLRNITEKYPAIDVIVVTGYIQTYRYTDVIKAGACDFITKPFGVDELGAKLNRAIREQRLIRRLEHISMCDVLTDLFNRRSFDVKLKEEIPRAHRQGYPVFLAMADVDKFKDYNDKMGHQAGDRVLQEMGKILKHCTREKVDWSFRLGGDEFAVIIPYATDDQVQQIAERILERYRKSGFFPTSLSIGLAQFVRHPERSWLGDSNNLVSRADKALYKAKNAGGNRVVHDTVEPQS